MISPSEKLALAILIAGALFFTRAFGETTAFVGVNVIPMDHERVLEDQTVVIEDGVIVAIGARDVVTAPRRAKVIKGEGRTLMPGLADMHAHIAGYTGDDNVGDNPAIAANQLLMYVATGVTLLRDTAGSPAHHVYKEKIASGALVGPDLYFTSPVLEGPNSVWDFARKLLDPADADALVKKYAEDGYWGVKVYHTLTADVYDAVIAAGLRYDIPIIGHVPFEVGIDRALAAKQYSIEHMRGYDFDGVPVEQLKAGGGRTPERFGSWLKMSDARMTALAEKTAAAGTWNAPTLAINRFLFDASSRAALADHPRFAMAHPSMQNAVLNANTLDAIFSPDAKAALEASNPRMLQMVKALNEAGAGLLIGTDAVIPAYVPGFTPIDEIAAFTEAGLTNFEALRAATADAARSLGVADRLGTVTVGKRANLILVDGDPLTDINALWALEGVMLGGVWRDFEELETLLNEMAETFDAPEKPETLQ